MKNLRTLMLLVSLGLAAQACSSAPVTETRTGNGSTPQGPMGSTEEATVTVTNFRYEPPTLEVPTGTTVTWVNQDEILHTVTSGTPEGATVPGVSEGAAAEPDGRFDEELDGGGATVEVTLDERGTYTYFCAIHGGMVGEIIVG